VTDVEELERRMPPGAWSHEGFLGPDERLEDVLRADRQTLEELELEPRELADTLDCLLELELELEGEGPRDPFFRTGSCLLTLPRDRVTIEPLT
jgi:hypothetical protein